MATLNANTSLAMDDAEFLDLSWFDLEIDLSITATDLTLDNGYGEIEQLSGSFVTDGDSPITPDGDPNVIGGTITGYQASSDFQTQYTIDDLNVDAVQAASFINQSQGPAVAALFLGGDDTVVGSEQNDVLLGFAGNDELFGMSGSDTLEGGAGNDVLDGGAGADVVNGGAGNDTAVFVVGQPGQADIYDGGVDTDTLRVELTGAQYADAAILADLEALQLFIDQNNDSTTASGATQMFANLGLQVGNFEALEILVDGQPVGANGAPTDIVLTGGTVEENSTAGTVVGQLSTVDPDADDTFSYRLVDNGGGRFALVGSQIVVAEGAVLDFETTPTVDVVVEVTDSAGNAFEKTLTVTLGDVGEIVGTDGNDRLNGTDGSDVMDGGAGNDRLSGRDGDDTILGGAGNDRISGGDGDDTIDAGDGNDRVYAGDGDDTVTAGDGNDRVYGWDGDDTVDGGAGNDYLRGGDGNDTLIGGDGDDRLRGDDGDDTLDGGAGNDRMSGGWGDDIVNGGDGNDYLSGSWGNDELNGGEGNDYLNGGSGDDELNGGAGNDVMRGGWGDDVVNGGDGDDYMTGYFGDDVMNGGAGDDRIIAGSGEDIVDAGDGDDYVSAGWGDDIVDGGAGDDFLRGHSGDDVMNGGDGNDYIDGGSGDDIVNGGAGDDVLRGGYRGDDTFVFEKGFGNDYVVDFRGGDMLDFSDFEITFDDLTLTQDGRDTVITVDGYEDDSVRLRRVDADDLDPFSDFILIA